METNHFWNIYKSAKVTWFISVVLVLLCGAVNTSIGEYVSLPKARIVLIDVQSGDLIRIITDKVNHEVVLTVPTTYRQAYLFECNASYPVEWNYFGEGAPTTNADVGRHFTDFYNVNSYTYQAVLFMHTLELNSGRYVCRGTHPEQEKLQAHYDLFVPGNGTQMLMSSAEKKVFVAESKLMTSLPCEVTDPSLTVNLFKENAWGAFLKLEMNDSIVFRPRKGFILKMHELPDPFGTYMCITHDNKRRRKVHLIPERFREKYDDTNNLGGGNKVPVLLSYDYEYNRFLCCNAAEGNSLAPKLQWAECGSVPDCKLKSVCFDEGRCGDTRHKWMDPGPLPRGCAGWKLNDGSEGDFGILKCSTPGITQYQPFLLNRGNIFVDFEVAPSSDMILTMTKLSTDSIYLGSEVEYRCNSSRFYFAFGIRWAFKRGNDDIEFIGESSSYIVRDEYPVMSHMRRTKFRILHPDIKAVICFVPIANSPTEWRTVSLPIAIREPFQAPPALLPIFPTQKSTSLEFINNRIPYGSASQARPVVESYSTSRPTILQNNRHSMEVDPTPSIDIDEIMSLGGNPTGPEIQNDGALSRHPFHIPSAYPSQIPGQEARVHPTPPYSPNHFRLPPTSTPAPLVMSTNQPEIITLDNVRNYKNEKYNFPTQAEIQEANMRHRHKLQMHHHEGIPYVTTTTTKSVWTTSPSTISPSRYQSIHAHKYSQAYDPYHGHNYDFEDKRKNIEVPRYQDFNQHKEYKVSSRLDIEPKISSIEMNRERKGSSHSDEYRHRVHFPSQSTTTQRSVHYLDDKGHLPISERDSVESFRAPTPVQLSHHQRQPLIHYDSREKQYGLRDPLIPMTNQWKKSGKKSKLEVDHSTEESQVHINHQPTPPTWDRSYGHNSDSKLMKSPVLEAEVPVSVDDLGSHPYSSDDYYISSLMARRKSQTPYNISTNKGYRRGSTKKGSKSSLDESNDESLGRTRSQYSPTSDYDGEREKYYYQRYADLKDPMKTLSPVLSHSSTPPIVQEQPYLFGENSVRRSGYHSKTGDFVEMG